MARKREEFTPEQHAERRRAHNTKRLGQLAGLLKGLLIFASIIIGLYFCLLAYSVVWIATGGGNGIIATIAAILFGIGEIMAVRLYIRRVRPWIYAKWALLQAWIAGKLRRN